MPFGGREFEAVVDQVIDYLPQAIGVASDGDSGLHDGGQLDAALLGHTAKHLYGALDEAVEANRTPIDGQLLGIRFGQQQQLVDQQAQLPAFVGDVAEHLLVLGGRPFAVERDLDRALHGCQRGAQLVGGIVDELAMPLQVVAQQVEKVVDRQRQFVQLVAGATNRQAFLEMAGAESRGGGDDPRQRARGPASQEKAQQGRDEQDHEACGHHQLRDLGQIVLQCGQRRADLHGIGRDPDLADPPRRDAIAGDGQKRGVAGAR